jgi:hypothetical protein
MALSREIRRAGRLAARPGPVEAALVEDTTIDRVRELCRELPECEITGGGHHTIRVRGRTLAWHTVDHHGDGRVALTVRAARGENAELVAADPGRFFLPRYVAHHGYVGVYLDTGDVDWEEVRELLRDAYGLVAPKTLVRRLE